MTSLNLTAIRRDSIILLVVLTVGSAIVGGLLSGVGTLAGGALVLVNFLLIARLVEQLTAGESSGLRIGLGLLIKTIGSLAALVVLLKLLPPIGVTVGLGTVIAVVAVRGLASLYAAPSHAREA